MKTCPFYRNKSEVQPDTVRADTLHVLAFGSFALRAGVSAASFLFHIGDGFVQRPHRCLSARTKIELRQDVFDVHPRSCTRDGELSADLLIGIPASYES
jgi:hypothetical protein